VREGISQRVQHVYTQTTRVFCFSYETLTGRVLGWEFQQKDIERHRPSERAKSNARGNGGLVWSEPGNALGLSKDPGPVKQGVIQS
jgi:hypothetical protein